MDMETMKELFARAPEVEIDPSLQPIIQRWDDEPSAVQVLELLDHGTHSGGLSDFVISALRIMLTQAMNSEGLAWNDLVAKVTWREADQLRIF